MDGLKLFYSTLNVTRQRKMYEKTKEVIITGLNNKMDNMYLYGIQMPGKQNGLYGKGSIVSVY